MTIKKSKMTKDVSKDLEKVTGAVYFNDLNNVVLNPAAYISLATAMKSDCTSMNIKEVNAWLKKWYEESGYTEKDLSVHYMILDFNGVHGYFETSILFSKISSDVGSCIHMTYEYAGNFTFRFDALGFLFVPSAVVDWLPDTLQKAFSDIKKIVLSSLNKVKSYPIKMWSYIDMEPSSVVNYYTYVPNEKELIIDIFSLFNRGLIDFCDKNIIKPGKERIILDVFFQSIPVLWSHTISWNYQEENK